METHQPTDRRTIRVDGTPTDAELLGLFRSSLEMLCIAGGDGYFKHVNPAFEKTLGHSAADLLARPFLEFIHPDDREPTQRVLRQLASGQPTIRFENRYRCRDGSYRWLSWMAMPDETGSRIYAVAADVTDRKQMETELRASEERFRLLIEHAPDAMVVVDHRGAIVLVNTLAESLFGYSRDELLGQAVELLVPHADRDQHVLHRAEYRARPYTRMMGMHRGLTARRKDGSEFPAEIALSPIETESGLLVYAAIRDVTERLRLEKTLRENQAQLLAAQRIQEHLLPHHQPQLPGYDIAGALHPAEFAAGDHFDFHAMPDGCLGIVVADVAGHGVGPAILMASVHAHLSSLAAISSRVDEILGKANRIVTREIDPDLFVTVFFGRLDPRDRTFVYASAGNPTAFVLDTRGALRASLPSTSLPLGVLDDAEFPCGETVPLQPGDIVALFTDGVTEAATPQGECFGQQRVVDIVAQHRAHSAAEIIAALNDAVLAFSDTTKHQDDFTVVVVKVDRA